MAKTKSCDLCQRAEITEYVDGKTKMGPWADMCLPCFDKHGVGLGTGRGQQYILRLDNIAGDTFTKVAG